MRMRLRQVALVAHDLAAAEASITEELGVELCYRDPDVAVFGLKNALFPIGDKLLEVVSPIEEGTTAGRQLSKRNGDGGYMVILQVDDLAPIESRVQKHGVRIVFTASRPGITGIHLHPKDVGGAILSIDQSDRWDDWGWAGPGWRDHVATGGVTDLVGVAMQSVHPARTADRWSAVLGRAVIESGDEYHVQLDEGVLRFVPPTDARGEGVCAVDVRAANAAIRRTTLCGVTINFVA
jgi:catechol 2,3-dioxygenase-like lactoylglutathione lyase family enzyme